jgi:hypothetical protein
LLLLLLLLHALHHLLLLLRHAGLAHGEALHARAHHVVIGNEALRTDRPREHLAV